jgi:hypothetical protein
MGRGICPEDRALLPCIVLLLVLAICNLLSRIWKCTTTPSSIESADLLAGYEDLGEEG